MTRQLPGRWTRAARSLQTRMAMVATTAVLTGCVVGPDYRPPEVVAPPQWRVEYAAAEAAANAVWWQGFGDIALNELVQAALDHNKDLRLAALRVEEARARLRIDRAARLPTLGYSASARDEHLSDERAIPVPRGVDHTHTDYSLGLDTRWEIDVWGRIRRSNEAALAELLSAEEGRRAVLLTLVAEVAGSYVRLLSLDRSLEIARLTVDGRKESLRLFELKHAGGAVSRLDLAQVRSIYEAAAADIPALELEVAKQENALSVLVGRDPGAIRRGGGLQQLSMPQIPAGLPSDILARRPDILGAEQQLIAANALIGVARSQYFPSLSLTGALGAVSEHLGDLLTRSAFTAFAAATTAGTIFDGGKTSAAVEVATARQQQALVGYERSIQGAFHEVNDALVSHHKFLERLDIEQRQVEALREYADLAKKAYDGGYTGYINVLDAERSLYEAQLSQAQTQSDALIALVTIYKTLGGGWPVGDAPGDPPVAVALALGEPAPEMPNHTAASRESPGATQDE